MFSVGILFELVFNDFTKISITIRYPHSKSKTLLKQESCLSYLIRCVQLQACLQSITLLLYAKLTIKGQNVDFFTYERSQSKLSESKLCLKHQSIKDRLMSSPIATSRPYFTWFGIDVKLLVPQSPLIVWAINKW